MKRREWLGASMAVCGAFWTGVSTSEANESQPTEEFVWNYEPIDPDQTAAKAYALYPDGSCMYASFRAIVESVGEARVEQHPEEKPFWKGFPYGMMFYGRGGVHDYGSLCGVLNGCAAAISLLVSDRKAAAGMTRELFDFYQTTPLPNYEPPQSQFSNMERSVSESVLCHISVSRWLVESEVEVESPRRKDRCKRLTADGVKKTVQLLNLYYEKLAMKKTCVFAGPMDPSATCIACHNPEGERKDANVRMNCGTCHSDLDSNHGTR